MGPGGMREGMGPGWSGSAYRGGEGHRGERNWEVRSLGGGAKPRGERKAAGLSRVWKGKAERRETGRGGAWVEEQGCGGRAWPRGDRKEEGPGWREKNVEGAWVEGRGLQGRIQERVYS